MSFLTFSVFFKTFSQFISKVVFVEPKDNFNKNETLFRGQKLIFISNFFTKVEGRFFESIFFFPEPKIKAIIALIWDEIYDV